LSSISVQCFSPFFGNPFIRKPFQKVRKKLSQMVFFVISHSNNLMGSNDHANSETSNISTCFDVQQISIKPATQLKCNTTERNTSDHVHKSTEKQILKRFPNRE
jgi:hypothetical protein